MRGYITSEYISAWTETLKQKQKYYSSAVNSSSKSTSDAPSTDAKQQ